VLIFKLVIILFALFCNHGQEWLNVYSFIGQPLSTEILLIFTFRVFSQPILYDIRELRSRSRLDGWFEGILKKDIDEFKIPVGCLMGTEVNFGIIAHSLNIIIDLAIRHYLHFDAIF